MECFPRGPAHCSFLPGAMNEPIRMLLVEDNAVVVRMIRDMLEQTSDTVFFIESVSRLSDARQRLSTGGVNLVLLDLALPDSQGLDTFVQLFNQTPEVPIVVLTALEDETVALTSLRDGAQDYLIKSEINPRTLVRSIHDAIERKRGEEARSRLAA